MSGPTPAILAIAAAAPSLLLAHNGNGGVELHPPEPFTGKNQDVGDWHEHKELYVLA